MNDIFSICQLTMMARNVSDISASWRVGFEIEVVLGALGDERFVAYEVDPMDTASSTYCQAVAKKLSGITGCSWIAPTTPKSKPGYYVLPEHDLDPINFPKGIVAGVELVTPPLAVKEADDLRQKIAMAIDELGGWPNFMTGEFTEGMGWHINIDAGKDRQLDMTRFALAAGELALLLKGGRYPSSYAAPQRHAYGVPLLRQLATDPAEGLAEIGFDNFIRHHGGYGKRYAANFDKLKKGYVELRHFAVDTCLGQTPLPDLLSTPIAAFQMDHKTQSRLVQSELKRFNVVKDWLTDIQPELNHILDEPSHFVSMRSGMINFAGEPAARLIWNGTTEISLIGRHKHAEVAVIRDQQYPDIFEALAVLALDVAEIRSGDLANMPLSNTAFSKAINELRRRLGKARLLKPVTIESASWWNPSGRARRDWF